MVGYDDDSNTCMDYFFAPEKLGQYDNADFSSDNCCAKRSLEISSEENGNCFDNEFGNLWDKDG